MFEARALRLLQAAFPDRPRIPSAAELYFRVQPANREDVIRMALADDEGFQILGEELLQPVIDLLNYEHRTRTLIGTPEMCRLVIPHRVGDRSRLDARDIDNMQAALRLHIEASLRFYNAQLSRENADPHVEVFRAGREHGWRINLRVCRFDREELGNQLANRDLDIPPPPPAREVCTSCGAVGNTPILHYAYCRAPRVYVADMLTGRLRLVDV